MSGFLLRFELCPTLDKGRDHGIFQRRKFGQKMMKLKYEPNAAVAKVGQCTFMEVSQINPTAAYRPLRRTVQPPHEMQERALPSARRSHDGHHLPSSNGQTHTL